MICVIKKILIFATGFFPKIHFCLSVSSGLTIDFLDIEGGSRGNIES